MALNSDALPHLAQGETTLATRIPVQARGEAFLLPNKLTAAGEPRDGRKCIAIVAKNDSGGALLPGRGVKFKSGDYGWELNGYTTTDDVADGFIDHTLPSAGVAALDACYVIVDGPVYGWSDGTVTTFRDIAKTGADGKVSLLDLTPSSDADGITEAMARVGLIEDATVAAVDATRCWVDVRCRK